MKSRSLQGNPYWRKTAAHAASVIGLRGDYMEHRWGVRRPCRARVVVSAGGDVTGTARLRDISLSGAFLETQLPLVPFSQIAVAVLNADGSRHPVELTASVVRTTPDGVGIEWCSNVSGSICDLIGCNETCATNPRC